MCGRYTLFVDQTELEERFDVRFADSSDGFSPRYNMAPGQQLPVITNDAPETIQRLEWGLIPSWAEDDSDGLINARAETVAEKPSFRDAYERRRSSPERHDGGHDTPSAGRCLVPADGFYEWVETDDGKQPYRVCFEDDRVFALAGLWERREPDDETTQAGLDSFGGGVETDEEDDGPLETFTIITTEPNEVVEDLHHRMAVILEPTAEREWLTADDPSDLLEPISAADMRAYPVSTAVNNPTVDDRSLVEPLES